MGLLKIYFVPYVLIHANRKQYPKDAKQFIAVVERLAIFVIVNMHMILDQQYCNRAKCT